MKKYLIQSIIFAAFGLMSGVFYREFTKIKEFTSNTMLSKAHPHILALGLGGFLLIALFAKVLNMKENKLTKASNIIYISGLSVTSLMMIIKGSLEVSGFTFTKSVTSALAGVAGVGHIALATGIIMFIICFIKAEKNKKEE